jgi:hypothetical protein
MIGKRNDEATISQPTGFEAAKIIAESCCYWAGMGDYKVVCKITSLFQGMVNPQVNLVQ